MRIVRKVKCFIWPGVFSRTMRPEERPTTALGSMRRAVVAALAFVMWGMGSPAYAAEPKINTEAEAVKVLGQFIKDRQLTTLAPECLRFDVSEPDKQIYVINVREYHDAICGGDPKTSPRLFSARIDKSSGTITTDVISNPR